MDTRTFRYIMITVFCIIAFILSAFSDVEETIRLSAFGIIVATSIYWCPENKEGEWNHKKNNIKGVIQYDMNNYESPAMRILFNEEPLNLINYDTVTLKVDKNACLKEEKYV